jgi:nicotinamidase-related amidase
MASALLVIDMLNPYEHEDAEPLKRSVEAILGPLAELISDGRRQDTLTVYVNDNHGDWSAAREQLTEQALSGNARALVEPIVPPEDIPFLVKARHSIFYQTPLEYLLGQQGVDRILLCGQVTEQCILYSALDAYVRHFEVVIARDCVAHIHRDLADAALRMMEVNMRAQVADSGAEALKALG